MTKIQALSLHIILIGIYIFAITFVYVTVDIPIIRILLYGTIYVAYLNLFDLIRRYTKNE